jgi:hypothetical protein
LRVRQVKPDQHGFEPKQRDEYKRAKGQEHSRYALTSSPPWDPIPWKQVQIECFNRKDKQKNSSIRTKLKSSSPLPLITRFCHL